MGAPWRAVAIAAVTVWAAGAEASPGGASRGPALSVAGFGGVVLDNDYQEVLVPTRIDPQGSYLAGLAGAVRVAEPLDGLELWAEAQLVRHVDGQRHWEVNAPVATARWTAFPWDEHADTSAAFGLGLSVTSETPGLERRNEGSSQPLMAYWMVELAVGPPRQDWEIIARLHHRSTAYGTFGDDGGANALVLGVRRQF